MTAAGAVAAAGVVTAAAVPLGAVAAGAMTVVVGAVAVAGVLGAMGEPDRNPSSDAPPVGTVEPSGSPEVVASEPPPAPPVADVSPSAIPTTDPTLGVPAQQPAEVVVAGPQLVIDRPPAGWQLLSGVADQSLNLTVRNIGDTAANDVVVDLALPAGVELVDVSGAAFDTVQGSFAAGSATAWACTDPDDGSSRCSLPRLGAGATAVLSLRVSVAEGVRTSGVLGLTVRGQGLTTRSPAVALQIAPEPARVVLAGTTPGEVVTGRSRLVALTLENAGGFPTTAGAPATVSVGVPAGVQASVADAGGWVCAEPVVQADGSGLLACSRDELAPDERSVLTLALVGTAEPDGVVRELSVMTSPGGPVTSRVPLSVTAPARLALSVPGAELAAGTTTEVGVVVSNTGGLVADDVRVEVTRPEETTWGAVPAGWTCDDGAGGTAGRTLVCRTGPLVPGSSTVLPLGLAVPVGTTGLASPLSVAVTAADADPAPRVDAALPVAVPVLSADAATPRLLLDGRGRGGVGVTATVAGRSAAGVVRVVVDLPAGLAHDGGSTAGTPGCTAGADGRQVVCDLGTVAAGASEGVLVPVRVTDGDDDRADRPVTATLTATGAAPVRATSATAAGTDALAVRFHAAGGWGAVSAGAPLLGCDPDDAACLAVVPADASGRRAANDDVAMTPLDEQGLGSSSSSAVVALPEGREIAFAGLYWSASLGPDDRWSGDRARARVLAPGGGWTTVKARTGDVRTASDASGRRYYQSFADVTGLVREAGGGTWAVGDVALPAGADGPTPSSYGGWALVVVVAEPGAGTSVTVADGATWVGGDAAVPLVALAGPAGSSARFDVVAWEGDAPTGGDLVALDAGPALAPRGGPAPAAPLADGAVNTFDSVATGWAGANSLGVDVKPFDVPSLSGGVQTLGAATTGDQFLVGVVAVTARPVE
ncbi:DUF11 domain-containing protein [Cellulomonas endophytica]|uniref:DUF11 domain-containing protein n=1 Tax=Cellulomonas endophytica TaxID=2494735 RepID=UPI0010137831|nr:DUF11 domain-containing protein [Cellulomonas endophytica]